MIYPATFLEIYNSWWPQLTHDTDDDIQFGLLILWLCLNGLQAIPHPKQPAHGIICTPLGVLENELYINAQKFDFRRPRVPSLVRVQQLFFHTCYLKNSGEIKESWFVLDAAVREAHELGLHLEDPGIQLNDFEKEIRRRTFWSLYVWDR